MFEDQEEYRKELNFNIDIEFSGVAYIDLPNRIEEIKIREIKDMVPAKFQLYRTIVGLKIFEIKSHKKLYYIVASSFVELQEKSGQKFVSIRPHFLGCYY